MEVKKRFIIPKDMPKIVLTIHNEDPETESPNRFCIIEGSQFINPK
ncbi:hypothetical protein EfmAA290_17680 [Enterococcus faecium]|nr:hypothetical protein EfmAA290_17680 [Enterococcus faecium]